jgi:hypothetical protein
MANDAPDTSNTDGNNTSGTTSTAGDEPKIITMTSQQLADRLARAKPADYDDLKAKAARVDELEQAGKTEIEKANDRAIAAEAEAAKVPSLVADALREHLVELHKIPAEKAELFLTAADPALLLRQVTALVGETKKNGNYVAREGTTQSTGDPKAGEREFVRGLFGQAD